MKWRRYKGKHRCDGKRCQCHHYKYSTAAVMAMAMTPSPIGITCGKCGCTS